MIGNGTWRYAVAVWVLAVSVAAPAWGIAEKGESPWNVTTKVGPDAKVGGWFINLGLTGARAKLTAAHPKALEVTYVFAGTPAAGKLLAGDMIVGANGKPFVTAHKHGYGVDKFGYEGPMMDFGNALAASEGNPAGKGKLVVDVVRKGKKQQVTLYIPTRYGAFARTYPARCRKSDLILREAYAYLAKRQGANGLWSGRPHLNAFPALALLASGEKRYLPNVKRAAQALARSTNDKITFGGLQCWKYALAGIVLSEYYLATGERWVLPELEEINRWLNRAQAPNGGWGHSAHNANGSNGYGAINIHTMQAKLAMTLMARCGVKIDRARFKAAHDFVVRGTNRIGYVWYKDGGAGNNRYADMGRTGAATLAHYYSPYGGKEYLAYAQRSAKCIGTNYKTFPDTHGSPILGMVWTALGAAVDPPSFRNLMDKNAWWFSLAHCPDGTFVYMPNRDNNPQDYTAAPRLSATAAVALILSIRDQRLQIMGAGAGIPGIDRGLLTRITRLPYEALAHKQYVKANGLLAKAAADRKATDQDKQMIGELRTLLDEAVSPAIDKIVKLDRVGDVAAAQAEIGRTRRLFKGIEAYDKATGEITASLRTDPKKTELKLGKQFEMIIELAVRTRDKDYIKGLGRFAERNAKSPYGKAAQAAIAILRDGDSQEDPRRAYFDKAMSELEE